MTHNSIPALRGGGEVSCRVFSFFDALEEAGVVRLADILESFPYPESYLRDYRNRIPWDDWADICDRFVLEMGSDEAAEVAAEHLMNSAIFDSVRGAAGAMLSPHQLYHVALKYLGPLTISNVRFDLVGDGNGSLLITLELDETYASARSWFLTTRVAIRLFPTFSGLPESLVLTHEYTSHRMVLEVTPPASLSWMSRARRVISSFGQQSSLVREFEFQHQALKTAYSALDSAEAGFGRMLDAMPLAVILHKRGEVRYKNPRAEKLLGDHQHLDVVVHEEDANDLASLLDQATSGEPVGLRVIANGNQIHVLANNVGGPQFEGEELDLFLALDVTGWRELQERVTMSERMASLGTLAAGIAHEINNPMTSVVGNLELALMALESSESAPDIRRFLVDALEGAGRASVIVRDMHAFAQNRDLDLRPVDLRNVVEVAARLCKPQFRHGVSLVEAFDEAPLAYGDEQHLVQVVVNLMNNAAQACESGGEVRVEVQGESGRPVLRIADDGSGMPEWMLSKIFDPFFSTKPGEGLGLGLAIARRLVGEMGASIEVSSQVGVGTTFELVFEPAILTDVSDSQRRESPVVGQTILVIEDEELVRRTLTWVLGKDNDVIALESALLALETLEVRQPDLIICDLVMPEMSGIEFFERLVVKKPALAERVVFVTGGSTSPRYEEFIETHHRRVLLKPFSVNSLHRVLTRVLSEG